MTHDAKKAKGPHRIATLGPRHGACNVCGDVGPLTDDHTPPKSCGGITAAELASLHDRLSAEGERWYVPRHFQAGVCYRTLCARCNGLLGTQYDPALAEMTAQVRAITGSSLRLPAYIALEIRPSAVMRSVLGHLAAQGVGRYGKGPLTEPLRGYILDDTSPLPTTLRMYYWLYPFRRQVLVRDAAMISLRTNAVFGFWLMKFLPLAFFVTLDEPPESLFHIAHFDSFRDLAATTTRRVNLPLRPLVHSEWPERPDDNTAILYGQEAMIAEPRAPRIKKRAAARLKDGK